jgi:predicted pyridoxine 5'-phosphate oxidase superfamily flavin-nucleotide-binding protein
VRHRFFDLAFTPAVQAEQARRGSRAGYAALSARRNDGATADVLEEQEFAFIAGRDSFYLATVSETGWPYVQHRGGPIGFVRRVDERSIGWAEYSGNRQYVSAGNVAADDRVAMIFVDYPHQERLKVLGHVRAYDAADRLDLARLLGIEHYEARVERFVIVTVEASTGTVPSISRRASPPRKSTSWLHRFTRGSPSSRHA